MADATDIPEEKSKLKSFIYSTAPIAYLPELNFL